MKIKKFQLKNGLKTIAVESHKSPVVSVQMWVRTGSADEQKGEGVSNLVFQDLTFLAEDWQRTNGP